MTRPRLALTLGDPAGVGPELAVRISDDPEVHAAAHLVIVGPGWAVERARAAVGGPAVPAAVSRCDVACSDAGVCEVGSPSAASGAWALATLEAAAGLAETGKVDGIVTGPVSKAAVHDAGYHTFVGHTEFFGRRVGVAEPTMFFWSRTLCVGLVTVHCALRDVPARVTPDRVQRTIARTAAAFRALDVPRPRLGVCGLNPHAGEQGMFGTEDAECIAPGIARAQTDGLDVTGPLPADTAFMRAGRGDFDAIIAMYHDQGLAPFKLVAFDSGVNVTLGLPYVRTSVDHGTAFDIAGTGAANPSSLKAAVLLAARLIHARPPAG